MTEVYEKRARLISRNANEKLKMCNVQTFQNELLYSGIFSMGQFICHLSRLLLKGHLDSAKFCSFGIWQPQKFNEKVLAKSKLSNLVAHG